MTILFYIEKCLRAKYFSIIALIAALMSPTAIYASSPRLLIALGPKCNFMAEDLAKKMQLQIVSGTYEEMKDAIRELDSAQPCHVTVMQGNRESLMYLAQEVGYDYLLLNEDLESALHTLNVILPTIPISDTQLPRTDPRQIGQFYHLMMQVDRIFKEHHIHYWATCGTLLGAVRHHGMVPWDDDLDLDMMEEEISRLEGLRGVLAEHGLALYYRPDFGFYKIYPINGTPITKDETLEVYPWKFPFVDIFPMTDVNGKIDYARRAWKEVFPREYFLPEDVLPPCIELSFGPMTIPVPSHYLGYLTQMYGEDWNRVAYVQFSHRNESGLKKVKVDLQNRLPPKYVLPK
jgi:lipopolysaccharide cholinephosphotransferase